MSKSININDDIYKKLEKRIGETEFKSVDDYVEYILNQVVQKLENKNEEKVSSKGKEVYSKEEEQKIKERLKGLGYLE